MSQQESARDSLPKSAASTLKSAQTQTIPEGTYGPHNSRVANALDPRVDSDLDTSKDAKSAAATGQGPANGGAPAASHATTLDPTSSAPVTDKDFA